VAKTSLEPPGAQDAALRTSANIKDHPKYHKFPTHTPAEYLPSLCLIDSPEVLPVYHHYYYYYYYYYYYHYYLYYYYYYYSMALQSL